MIFMLTMQRVCRVGALAVLLLSLGTDCRRVYGEERSMNQLPAEAVASWKKYVEQISHYQVTFEEKVTDMLTGEIRHHSRGNARMSGDWAVSEGEGLKGFGERTRSAFGLNSGYAFRLNGRQKGWGVDELSWLKLSPEPRGGLPTDQSHLSFSAKKRRWAVTLGTLCPALKMSGVWFPSLVNAKEFRIQSVTDETIDGERLVAVTFLYNPPANVRAQIRDGTVWLVPGRYWLIHHAEMKGDWGEGDTGKILIANQFTSTEDGLPVVKMHQMDWIGTSGKAKTPVHSRVMRDYDDWKPSSTEERDYQLTAFGIPEPAEAPGRGKRIALVVVNLILGLAVITWLFVRKYWQNR